MVHILQVVCREDAATQSGHDSSYLSRSSRAEHIRIVELFSGTLLRVCCELPTATTTETVGILPSDGYGLGMDSRLGIPFLALRYSDEYS